MSIDEYFNNLDERIRILNDCLDKLNVEHASVREDPKDPYYKQKTTLLISGRIDDILDKLLYLDQRRADVEAGRIIVQPPTPGQITGMDEALAELHQAVQQTQTVVAVIQNLTTILNGIGSI